MSKRIALYATAVAVAAGLALPAAAVASRTMLVGINDEANTLYGNPATTFPILKQLRNQVIRVNLYWGGNRYGVAKRRPADPTDPGDPAYDWRLYDRLVRYASQYNELVMFSILFTPPWANGGKPKNNPPTNYNDLRDFAYAAGVRYSGFWTPPPWQQDPGNATTATPLPRVVFWTAWNEPNNPIWLSPQYKKVGRTYRIESAVAYAKICNAVYQGLKSVQKAPGQGGIPGLRVACGVTGPRGNNAPRSSRPSVSPLAFLRACKRYGLRTFDYWAHHPYYGAPTEKPTFNPHGTAVQLGNINDLVRELTRLYGNKKLWITEYGYQTTPQDRRFGVTWAKQALYLRQAWQIAYANPRIDMFLWFMVKDDTNVAAGWQSGLLTATGRRKPAFTVFENLPRVGNLGKVRSSLVYH